MNAQEALNAVHDAACEAFDLICHPAAHGGNTAPQALHDVFANIQHHAGYLTKRTENGCANRRELRHKLRYR